MIPINISKPTDMAIIFAIFALVVVTFGFGITSVESNQNYTGDTTFFTNVSARVQTADGFKGSADEVSEGLVGQEGASNLPSEEGILVQGFNAVRQIGQNFQIMSASLNDAGIFLGIPTFYIVIFTGVLVFAFAVVMFSFIFRR